MKKHSGDAASPAGGQVEFEPSTRTFLDSLSSDEITVDPREAGIDAFRAAAKTLQLLHTSAVPDAVRIENRAIPGRSGDIPVRLYRSTSCDAPGPILVYLHGGGWVVGGLDEYDGVCSNLCHYGEVTVVSVDYRLAPEHKFPAAVEDSLDAVAWVAANQVELGGLPDKLGVAGDSSGGNLAAVVCQEFLQEGLPAIDRQILIYPCLAPRDYARYPSQLAYGGEEFFLSEAGLDFMLAQYLASTDDAADPRLWPALNTRLDGLPSTYIVTAEFDLLRDEARAYADAMTNCGITVEHRDYAGTIHGFFCFAGSIKPGQAALDDLCAYLRQW